eukprot:CAMPEP_0185774282 /NCGR_PEP_ID=MMETSP1174-20130828/77473_1 /TAXON_ID=35687 /ORGANISM="Dictyocha speculum, Strain CCMP1381" /LENGTH=428 /DNA_ID=CAMNT_0028461371 /DNA_START=73 /DNA_END=1362 /DNA_ORIENTATION=+
MVSGLPAINGAAATATATAAATGLPPILGAAESPETDASSERLTPIEAQRAIAILSETIEKITFIGSITPDVLQHRDELSKVVGDEISHVIHEQRRLEARYEQLIIERTQLKGKVNKTKYKQVQSEIQDVSRALRDFTKSLTRNLKDNPHIKGNMDKIKEERTDLIDTLSKTIEELMQAGAYASLSQKVVEDQRVQTGRSDSIAREVRVADAVKKIEFELKSEREDHDAVMQEQKAEIAELKEKLNNCRSKAVLDAKYHRKDCKAKVQAAQRIFYQQELEMEETIRRDTRRLELECLASSDTKKFLEERQTVLGGSLDEWTRKRERDLGKLQSKYALLKKEQVKKKEKLEKLMKRKDREDEEARQYLEMEAREARLEAVRKKQEQIENDAAAKIQFMERKRQLKSAAAKAEKAASKKAKKGGKKGKKK